ncbi:MAG: DNA cytosine methyltransferase [Phycisphaerales bacterium]|nr:DNA cytosine methyltransferase [Phycisphaerales bacterium]
MAPKHLPRDEQIAKRTAFDCFAGCGGLSQGLKGAGYRVVGAIENDPVAASVYELNHPNTLLWCSDIRRVSVNDVLSRLRLRRGQLDLIGGCPPCQGFSKLRTYNGSRRIRDRQNDLIFEFERLVLGLRPKRVMLENVPGLLRDQRLRRFRDALENAGYSVEADVIDVANYGVPQRRQRLVLLASRVSAVRFAEPASRTRTVRDAIGSLPRAGRSGDSLHDLPEKRSRLVAARIRAIPSDGGGRESLPGRLKLTCHRHSDGFKDVYGRMAWDEPAPTITTGCFNPSKGRFLHPSANRAITMREAALLQSFPKYYKFPSELGKVKIATMIGNALPPRFIRAHARALK